jgi:DNA-binding response OmpR family regulator
MCTMTPPLRPDPVVAPPRDGLPDARDRILLVDDDGRIRQALTLALDDEGFAVWAVGSGEQALAALGRGSTDVVLLDLMLPGMDGLAVCRRLRAQGDLPIIIITARSDSSEVIAGLEAGADDYVTKPIAAGELAARIRTLLRRSRPPTDGGELWIGDIELRPDQGLVRCHRGGSERSGIHLTRTEFRLLVELATAEGKVVTREDLLRRIWGYDYLGDTRLLDVHVRRLRVKIEPDPDAPTLVLTVRGAGYRAVGRADATD